MEVYIISVLTTILSVTVLYGSYQLWKSNLIVGGLINLMTGIVTLITYCYLIWVIPILTELGVVGFLLCVPSLVSGILGVISNRFFNKMLP